jgi:hypothetical protein
MSLHEEWISRDGQHSPTSRSGGGGGGIGAREDPTQRRRRSREDLFADSDPAALTPIRDHNSSGSNNGGSDGAFSEHETIMNVSEFLQRDRGLSRKASHSRRAFGFESNTPQVPLLGEGGSGGNDSFRNDSFGAGSSYASIDSFLFGPSQKFRSAPGASGMAFHINKWCWRVPRVTSVALLPLYIGCVMSMFALDRRRRAQPLFVNEKDWMMLLMIGIANQLSLLPVVVNLIVPDALETFKELHSPSDYYAPFVLYPISSIFFSVVAIAYAILDKKAQRKNRVEVSMRRRSKLQTIYAHLTNCVEFRSEGLIPVVLIASAVFTMSCRFCTRTSGVECTGANQFWDPFHLSKVVFYSAALLQFCMYVCLCGLSALAIGMFWQHQKLVNVFTFPEKYGARAPKAANVLFPGGSPKADGAPPTSHTRLLGGAPSSQPRDASGKRGKRGFVKEIDWHDLSNPEGIANYTVLYQHIIGSMNGHPVMTSICTPAFACSVVIFIVSLGVVVIDNMYQGHGFADYTFIFMSLTTIAGTVISLFIGLTVQLDKTISMQSRIIAKVQNDVQQLIDARRKKWVSAATLQHSAGESRGGGGDTVVMIDNDAMGGLEGGRALPMKLLEAKVNALQALDVYVRIADSTPKLIGMSLNTIRWTTILALLMFINFFFILLYRIYCFDDPAPHRTRSHTLTMQPVTEDV